MADRKPCKPSFLDHHISVLSTVGLFLCVGAAILYQPFTEKYPKPTSTTIIESPNRVPLPKPARFVPGAKDGTSVIMDKEGQLKLRSALMDTSTKISSK